jgi:GNAT superfamily N-acetyltransferase
LTGVAGVTIRRAEAGDLQSIVALFAGDDKAGKGDAWTPATIPAYEQAMQAIMASADTRLFVAVAADRQSDAAGEDAAVVGTFQVTLIPGLAARGRLRAKIESVHVAPNLRGQGIGARMMQHAIAEAKAAGAGIVELMSDTRREAAHRFYDRLGFTASHKGFKLLIE